MIVREFEILKSLHRFCNVDWYLHVDNFYFLQKYVKRHFFVVFYFDKFMNCVWQMRVAFLQFITRIQFEIFVVIVWIVIIVQKISNETIFSHWTIFCKKTNNNFIEISVHISFRRHDEKFCRALRSTISTSSKITKKNWNKI